jgi:hypothetical protein
MKNFLEMANDLSLSVALGEYGLLRAIVYIELIELKKSPFSNPSAESVFKFLLV